MAGNTRERILEVSLELFAQSGYLGTSMSDIAKQLGITKGALYKHYRSKQEILDRIADGEDGFDIIDEYGLEPDYLEDLICW